MIYKDYFSILEYYKKVLIPKNPNHYKIKSDKMMVCPLHDDVNPSMGIVVGKDGEELFHCFGCNQWGNIVELNKKVNRRVFKKYLTDKESLQELCNLFNVPFEKVDSEEQTVENDDVRIDMAIDKAIDKYDISDYKRLIVEGKLKKKGISYFNTITMMMINELKND